MKLSILLALVLAFLLWSRACLAADSWGPDFEGKTLSGDTFRIEDHIGKDVIVLNFFTTTCGPCRNEMAALNTFYIDHQKDGLAVVGIDVIEDPSQVREFVKWLATDYPMFDDNGDLSKALGVSKYPTTVIIGVDGKIQYAAPDPIDVPVLLGARLKANQRLLKEGKAISKDAFLKAREQAGQHLIRMTPPEVKPVAGSGKDTPMRR